MMKIKVLMIIFSISSIVYTNLIYATTEPLFRVKYSILGEPKLNNPFDLKVIIEYKWGKYKLQEAEVFDMELLFNYEKEIPEHIEILSGSREFTITIPKGKSRGEYTIKMVIKEVSQNRIMIYEKKRHWFVKEEVILYTTLAEGEASVNSPNYKSYYILGIPLDSNAQKEWEEKIERMRKEIGRERSKIRVEIGRKFFFYTPSGDIKIWGLVGTSEKYPVEIIDLLTDEERDKYLPLIYLDYDRGG